MPRRMKILAGTLVSEGLKAILLKCSFCKMSVSKWKRHYCRARFRYDLKIRVPISREYLATKQIRMDEEWWKEMLEQLPSVEIS